jgi:hypothetical protein
MQLNLFFHSTILTMLACYISIQVFLFFYQQHIVVHTYLKNFYTCVINIFGSTPLLKNHTLDVTKVCQHGMRLRTNILNSEL